MKQSVLILIICSTLSLFSYKSYAQKPTKAELYSIDSLKLLLQKHKKEDTVRINLLNKIASKTVKSDKEKSIEYAKKAGVIAKRVNYSKGQAESLRLTFRYYISNGDYPKALDYLKEYYTVLQKIDDKPEMSTCLNNIGAIYLNQGNYPQALEYLQKSLKIKEELNDEQGISNTLNNIGITYRRHGNNAKALEYYQQSLKLRKKLNDEEGIGTSYNNIGIIYRFQDNYPKALEYYKKALRMQTKLGKKHGIAMALDNIALIYLYQENPEKAFEYSFRSLKIRNELGDRYEICLSYENVGALYFETKDYDKALDYTLKSLKIAEELGLATDLENIYKQLADIYSATGKYKKAYHSYIKYKKYNDSIFSKKNIKKIADLENQYEFNKEKQTIKAEQLKKEAVFKEKSKTHRIVRNSLIIGVSFLFFFAAYILYNYYLKRKSNRILTLQKNKIGEKNKILLQQKEQLQTQSEELQSKSEALHSANQRLKELDHYKGDMVRMIVHDLKNPLNSIIGLAENDIVRQSGMSMLNMVTNILDVQKHEDTEIQLKTSPVSIDTIGNSALGQVYLLYKQKNITVENNLKDFLVTVEHEIIERVFVNILTNAVKYTPNNGRITLSSTLQSPENQKKIVRVEISDTGKGIPKDKLDRIFDKFTQIESRMSGVVKATGIGLTFCKLFIEAHGGKIGAKSEPNSGTTIWFTVPASNSTKKIPPQKKEFAKQSHLKLSKQDKELLQPVISKLKRIEVYETTDIETVLEQFDFKANERVKQWKIKLDNALYVLNEESYNKLLEL